MKSLDRAQAQIELESWIENQELKVLSPTEMKLRTIMIEKVKTLRDSVRIGLIDKKRYKYVYDVELGCELYSFLEKNNFTLREASDVGVWRYISVVVLPDLVKIRWDNEVKPERYWAVPNRIWLKTLWWYIHLSWKGDIIETKKMLLSPNFNTDIILNLVDRVGKDGYRIDVFRLIMECYSKVEVHEASRQKELFRNVMKLHVAQNIVIEPKASYGGELGYVESLFYQLGIELEE